tara:strand:- start:2703 stop:3347 length:645 start_codon:yes stop_codon:yes gene_type:complete
MNKEELKNLVKSYFKLEDIKTETSKEEFAGAKLIDGTKIETDGDGGFRIGQIAHVITESGEKVTAPSGEHELEDGTILVIKGNGEIDGIKTKDGEAEGSLAEGMSAEEAPVEAKTELAEEEIEIDAISMDEDAIKTAVVEAIAEVVAPEIEAMKKKMGELEVKVGDYMSKPASVPSSEKKFSAKSKEAFASKPVLNQKRYDRALSNLKLTTKTK